MDDKSNTLFYIQLAVVLGSLICTGVLIRKAASFHTKLWLAGLVFVVASIAFTFLGVTIPIFFFSDSQKVQSSLTIDIMIFSAIGLILIGIICFAIDHMYERPTYLVISAAAILAVGLTPFYYNFKQDQINEYFNIEIVPPEPPRETIPNPNPPGWFK